MAIKRWIFGERREGVGHVINIVGSEEQPLPEFPATDVFEDPTGSSAVGDTYDIKEVDYSKYDEAILTLLFQLIKGTLPGGFPQPNLTPAQYKNYIKSLMK